MKRGWDSEGEIAAAGASAGERGLFFWFVARGSTWTVYRFSLILFIYGALFFSRRSGVPQVCLIESVRFGCGVMWKVEWKNLSFSGASRVQNCGPFLSERYVGVEFLHLLRLEAYWFLRLVLSLQSSCPLSRTTCRPANSLARVSSTAGT